MLFTTSWDDGYALDLRLGDILKRHNCTGTFYACPTDQHEENLLTEDQIRLLSDDHEIGAHTINHPRLSKLSSEEMKKEIMESKQWVERVTGKPCKMFCYPYGDGNAEVASIVRAAGFLGARTTEDLRFAFKDPLAMPTTIQLYPMPWRPKYSRWWHPLDPAGPLRARFPRLRKLGVPVSMMNSWLNITRSLFDHAVQTHQPFFHLWGHSHEVEKYDLWDDLEIFLKHVQASKVECVTNADIIEQSSL